MTDIWNWLFKIKELLSLTPKQIFIIAFISWAIILIPIQILNFFGLSTLRQAALPYLASIAIISLLWLSALYFYNLTLKKKNEKNILGYLNDLTPIEQAYLCKFVEPNFLL